MIRPAGALVMGALVLLTATLASAEPILKPRKYYGPIPQAGVSLRVGAFGGASNVEMIDFLDGKRVKSEPASTEDFGNGLTLEVGYTYKPHPQFGMRVNASVSLLRSSASGVFVIQDPSVPDTLALPAVKFEREVNVDLIVVEASGIYFFSDAAVKEFQTYLGGGFSVGFPHEVFKEKHVDFDTGDPYTDEIRGAPTEASEWGVSAGVHAVLGAIYYLTNSIGITAEGRAQLMEGRFEQLETPNEDGEFEQVSFVIDYTGFYGTLGVLWAF